MVIYILKKQILDIEMRERIKGNGKKKKSVDIFCQYHSLCYTLYVIILIIGVQVGVSREIPFIFFFFNLRHEIVPKSS